jgi:hypothetical protein
LAEFERILQLTPGTLSQQWYEDGVAVDPGTVTIGITRADGTTLVAAGTGTTGTGTAARTYSLTTTHTALLDRLTVTWTSTSKGTLTSYLEVVGGFLVSLSDLGTVLTGKTAAQLADKRTAIEQRLEKELGYAVVPRYALENRRARDGVVATRLSLRAVRSISTTSAGVTTPYSVAQLSALTLESWGVCGVWTRGPVTIGYEHGEDFPDSDIAEAALLLADEAYGSAVDGRVVRQEADNMAVTYASPSSSGPFIGARLNQIIRANRMAAIA